MEEMWREIRNDTGHEQTPFRFQGTGDLNSYKLFAENLHFLTKHEGRIGIILPAGIYSDYGNQELRALFFDQSQWEWIYSFENRNGIFDIHRSFKFCSTILKKGGDTEQLKCQFMVHDLDKWNTKQSPEHIKISLDQIIRFNPNIRSVLEVKNEKHIEILDKVYQNSILIDEMDLEHNTEFHMGSDVGYFQEIEELEDENIEIDENGIGWKNDSIAALPLIEGRHLDSFDFQSSAYISGHGRSADWDELDWSEKRLEPRYWVLEEDLVDLPEVLVDKLAFMKVTAATNKRTIRASVVPPYPCADAVPVLHHKSMEMDDYHILSTILNSYVLDFVARTKIHGLNANWYILKSFPIPEFPDEGRNKLLKLSRKLHSPIPDIEQSDNGLTVTFTDSETTRDEKKRAQFREEIDRIVADLYGLSDEDMEWILRPDNDDPRNLWKDYKERLKLLGGEGNWGKLPEEELKELEDENGENEGDNE